MVVKRHNPRFRERLAANRVIAILRAEDTDYFSDVGQVLYDAGIRAVEAALTTPGALDAIAELRVDLGQDALVGAGSVRTPSDVDASAAAGADFLVTPTFSPDVLRRAHDRSLPVACGALTPTEIENAWQHGAAVVKVFPIAQVGGVDYVKAVRAPLPDIPLVPTGGVTLSDVDDYLAAGAFAVAAASPLVGDSVSGGSLDDLARRAYQVASIAGKYA